jgi:hypothetical protein
VPLGTFALLSSSRLREALSETFDLLAVAGAEGREVAVDSTGRLAPRLLSRLSKRSFLFASEAFEGGGAADRANLPHRQHEAVRESLPDGNLLLAAIIESLIRALDNRHNRHIGCGD